MPRRLNDSVDVKVAVATSAGTGGGAELVPTAVNGTGFSRARFIFTVGNGVATTAALAANAGVWEASTSGATYASRANAVLTAVTSGLISSACYLAVVDMAISSGTPWLKFSGSITSTGVPHGCVVELYHGHNRPPTSSASQLVTV